MSGKQNTSRLTESMIREIEEIVNDPMFPEQPTARNETTPGASSIGTTPDPLNTAFINTDETTDASAPGSQISLSQPRPQSQTTKETSSTLQGLLSQIVRQEGYPMIDLRTPTKTTMVSTGTMPRTPMMKSVGTMPRTPTMASTGTMPKTPTMASTGTMPKTPTMASTGTMPRTPSPAATHDIIDLCSPSTSPTTDIRASVVEIIDLTSFPNTPTKAASGRHSSPQ